MKAIRYGLIIAALVAGSISFSASDTAWAKGASKSSSTAKVVSGNKNTPSRTVPKATQKAVPNATSKTVQNTTPKTTYRPRTNPLLQINSKAVQQDELSVQLEIKHTYYHPQLTYMTNTAAPVKVATVQAVTSSDEPKVPVSKRYNADFIMRETPAPPVVTAVAASVQAPVTAEGEAARISQAYGISAADLQGLTLTDLKELDAKIRCIQRLKASYGVSDAEVANKSLQDLTAMEAAYAAGRN